MISKMTKRTLARRRGYWFTTEKGQHLFAEEGETPKEACERYYAERERKEEKTEELRRKVEGQSPQVEERAEEYTTPEEIDRLYGEEFKGYKGQAAIDKLLKERRGHVKGAFHRDDMGDIDLVWGSDTAGLQHIIKQRSAERVDEKGKSEHVNEILSNIAETIENGMCEGKNSRGNFEVFIDKGQCRYFSIIAPEYHKHKVTYVVTAYRRGKKKER